MLKETIYTELKREVTDSLKKEIIAFANTSGGKIYIGIDDDGEIVGIKDVDFELTKITNMVRDSISPDITMFIDYKIDNKNGCDILEIHVGSGNKKPYYIRKKGLKSTGVYVRQGMSTVPASEDNIKKMIKEADGDSYEKMRSTNQDLTFEVLHGEFSKRDLPLAKSHFINLGLMTQNDNLYTNLGLLLSEQNVHTIKVAFFQGIDKAIFRDRKEFDGSILKQMNEVYDHLMKYNRLKGEIIGLERHDNYDYPEVALREALLNTIVHRDYSFSGSILISILDDRIEFVTIGGLVHGIELEDIYMGISQSRNEKLANVFHRLNLIEAYGTGISKILKSYSKFGITPLFEVSKNAFKLTLFNTNYRSEIGNLNDNEQIVIRLFSKLEKVTRRDVEQAVSVSQTMAGKILKSLSEKKLIEKRGGGANTYYFKI